MGRLVSSLFLENLENRRNSHINEMLGQGRAGIWEGIWQPWDPCSPERRLILLLLPKGSLPTRKSLPLFAGMEFAGQQHPFLVSPREGSFLRRDICICLWGDPF